MKTKILIAVLGIIVVGAPLLAWTTDKLYVHIEYNEGRDRVLFIQDLETGTRCYAITNDVLNSSGYAISCVPKGR